VDKALSTQRVNLAILIFNVVGAVVYLVRASLGWRIPQEHGVVPVAGEPFVWFVAILPIIVVYPLLNLAWAGFIVVRRQWRSGRLWLLTVAIWVCAISIDFAHH
jgi:hypothetical protein